MRSQPSSTSRTDEADTPEDGQETTGARQQRAGTALCLSGGGYRAALFHLGAARRLNELGILGALRTISGVSGGSIMANLLADPRLGFPAPGSTGSVHGFDEYVAAPLNTLASRNVRTPALLAKVAPWTWAKPDVAVRALADQLAEVIDWWDTPLRDNSDVGPAIVTSATEVAYGVNWVFEDPTAWRPRGRVGDYRVGYADPPADLRIADVVAASCAFPPYFAPMVVNGDALHLTSGHPGLESEAERARIRRHIRLTDGGVYDNLGLEPVWKSHRAVLVSDGGAVFRARTERTQYGRLLRILGIATSGGQSVRTRWLHASFARGVLAGASWALDSLIDGSYPREVTELINAVRTDLDAFSQAEQQVLERHGYVVADHHLRAHAADLIAIDAPLTPPHADVADPAVAARALADSSVRRLLGRT
jgi:NTE family protein